MKDVIVYQRTGSEIPMQAGRDHWWHDLDRDVSEVFPAEPLDSEADNVAEVERRVQGFLAHRLPLLRRIGVVSF